MERWLLLLVALTVCSTVVAKTGRTYYDDDLMARVKQKLAQYEWARSQATAARGECEWLVKMPDAELWDFIPPPEQMRAINVCIAHDCPICGDEVNRKAGHYPWIISRDLPFKVKCPVCNTVFPGNDFKPWNTEGLAGKPAEGEGYVDNGLGWLDKRDGRRYWFVSYYIFWQRWSRDVLGGLSSLKTAYLLTGEPVYAHKAAVMLAKLASDWERFDYGTQCYHEGMFKIRGRIMDYIWSTGNFTNLAQAYDAVYPALAGDAELAALLQARGLPPATELLEQRLLYPMVKDVMDGYVAGNMGMHQVTLATLGIVLDNGDPQRGTTKQQIADWLMSGGGRIEDLLYNGFVREGLGAESAPGYASGWGSYFYEVAQLLPKLGIDIWSNPKLKKMADIGLDLTVAGAFSPSTGDSGALSGTGPVARSASLQGPALGHYHDPRHAQTLRDLGAVPSTLFEDEFDPAEVERLLARGPVDMSLPTRNLGGYGCAILEAGSGEHRRGVSLYYGDASGGHGHYDRLNTEFFAYGFPVMPDDGYPTPFTRPDFYEWRRADTYKHHLVMIDELPQQTLSAGQLQALASAPGVQYADVSAEVAYPALASLYRRTCALVDVSPERSYLLDIFRVRGGSQHDWCYHTAVPQVEIRGGTPGPAQSKGTLAGEGVAYGKRPPARSVAGGVSFDLAGGEGVKTGGPYGELGKTAWTPHVRGVVTYKDGATLSLKVPAIRPGRYKLFAQYWDHKPGRTELELALGKTVVPLVIDYTDSNGYKWLSQVVELPEVVETIRLTARSSATGYYMINALALGTDLQASAPAVAESVSSGFQGLFNVQRFRPAGAWQTSWTQPQRQVAVTMTMPAGCAQEVIVADGEPEAQRGNPRTIKYVLARNAGDGQGGALLSRYVSVVEPHQGAAAVTAVELLHAAGAAPESTGVLVRRNADPVGRGPVPRPNTDAVEPGPVQRAATSAAGREVLDLVHSALTREQPVTWKGAPKPFSATGEFALLTVDAEGVRRAMLVNGTALSYGDFALKVAPPPAGKIAAVSLADNTVTLDGRLPSPEAYLGREIILRNELHQTAFTIRLVRQAEGRTVIGFGDTLCVAGMALAKSLEQAQGSIECTGPLSGYGKTFGGRHQGRWLYNEDKSQALRIRAVDGSRFLLDAPGAELAAIYRDSNGDGRIQLWISEIGPGDAYQIPATTYVQRVAEGQYRVETMTAAEVSVPRQANSGGD